jgi:hypothetical protein
LNAGTGRKPHSAILSAVQSTLPASRAKGPFYPSAKAQAHPPNDPDDRTISEDTTNLCTAAVSQRSLSKIEKNSPSQREEIG